MILLALWLSVPCTVQDDDALRAALARPVRHAAPASFRDLWDRPERLVGGLVEVEGRAVRRFRQPTRDDDQTGQAWPALTELWLVTVDGNLIGVIYPTPDAADVPLGAAVRFQGTFVRLVDYEAGDNAARRSPLIAGPLPPGSVSPRVPPSQSASSDPTMRGGIVPAVLAALAGLALAWFQLRRPAPFVDREPRP